MDIPPYPKVYALGYPDIAPLLEGPVLVQEKVDGSQMSFAWDQDGVLWARSKGAQIDVTRPDSLFAPAIDYLRGLAPRLGRVYRAETLARPRHNTITYDHVPRGHVILFDVQHYDEFSFPCWAHDETDARDSLANAAADLGVEAVMSSVVSGEQVSMDVIHSWLEADSALGGARVEGVVIKNYRQTLRGHPMVGKYVSEAFKETHRVSWKARNPGPDDMVAAILEALNTPARFQKAVQHLAERDALEHSPRDIGALMSEVKDDILAEERQFILEQLGEFFIPRIARGLGRGLPEWYKEQLAERQMS
jgi:hypothetical protein